MAVSPKLGRPPATNSAETKARILDSARHKFAAFGYGAASNRALAEAAGLTTGAIYHYFESKLDIYVAVYEEARRRVFDRFESAVARHETFADRLKAMLEAAHELNIEDPTLAQFLGSSRVDAARNPELAHALRSVGPRQNNFFTDLVESGVRSGEIAAGDRELVMAMLRTVTTGLTDAVSNDRQRHRNAVDAINRLVSGSLIERPG